MKIFQTDQIRRLDARTIELEGIRSSALMDRAATALFTRIRQLVDFSDKILVLAGPGNNGGDGLVIARLLLQAGYQVTTVLCNFGRKLSEDNTLQLERLKRVPVSHLLIPDTPVILESLKDYDWLIDSLFGSGLNRPLEGDFAATVSWINQQPIRKLAIDLPSGLYGEENDINAGRIIVKADLTLGLQFPRLAFLLPENEVFIGEWELVDIGLHQQAIQSTDTPYTLTTLQEVSGWLKRRSRFAHKGICGKSLLIAGSKGMTGAAILAGKGALRAGTGLLTLRIPEPSLIIVQTALPEATAQTYSDHFWDDDCSVNGWTAIAVGPGLGNNHAGMASLERLLRQQPQRLVLDADALNMLAEKPALMKLLPYGTILTPHPGEFERLAGTTSKTGYKRLQAAITFAVDHQVYLVLKGAYSACITPEGTCQFNATGNPGMATGGSGDVLTGIIVSLLAQGYTQREACVLGTCLHGLSADLLLTVQSQESLTAGDIAGNLGAAFKQLRKS